MITINDLEIKEETTLSFEITNVKCSSELKIKYRAGELIMKYIVIKNNVVPISIVVVLRNLNLEEEVYEVNDIYKESGKLVLQVDGKHGKEYTIYTNVLLKALM